MNHSILPDEAALDFGIYIGQKSIDDEEELASYIYEGVDENGNGNVYYYYDNPWITGMT